ncbi:MULTISPECIES: pentapeptide repeat-containing protein [Halococcus]|uniref:Ion transport 2 domain-containing protein n=1 Tax=Halococcus salifodinae DSM 8989 TaxID=1227456 RepID=M0MYF1_9EURY|nr:MULTISPECIES: pentapeptide repeat-containing protein [Halococcus]EMA49879.1 Ion transport 2 domain-containing protein [Halococcus salifodinae DSM 8989]
MSKTRCGYVEDVELLTNRGTARCWRPVRGDDDRCFWHDGSPKTREALDSHRPEPGERLDGADLRGADLTGASWLRGRSLVGADFTGATLRGTDLTGADCRRATFDRVDARRACFDGADVEGATFDDIDLREASLDGTKLYRASFTDVRLDRATDFGDRVIYESLVDDAEDRETRVATLEAASWTYRELRRLFEQDALPQRSRACYLGEKSTRRRAAWAGGEYLRALKLEGSRWVMRYGTSPTRVVTSSVVVMGCSGILYPLTGGLRTDSGTYGFEQPVADVLAATPGQLVRVFYNGLYFSVVTFSTLSYGDIQPIGAGARAIAGVEALLGSVLMALLLFVLTQRV